MVAIMKSFNLLLKQVRRDGMLMMSFVAILLAALFFRFGVPTLEGFLSNYLNQPLILSRYYDLIDLTLVILTPYLFCFISSMVMLDEYDGHIIHHLQITPVRKQGYLISRLIIPTFLGYVISMIITPLFSLGQWSITNLVFVCLLSSLMCLILSLLIFSFSNNKVEGLTVAKLAGLTMIGVYIPYLVKDNVQYFFSLLPSFWIGKFKLEQNFLYVFASLSTSFVWIMLLYKKFKHKISR